MNILTILKQLKNIEPDREFSRKSRSLVLGRESEKRLTLGEWILNNLGAAAALALASVLIFVIIGGFSNWKIFSPLKLSSLDPASLRAEAEAIDIQIKLSNVGYSAPNLIKQAESTLSAAPQGAKGSQVSGLNASSSSTNSTSSEALSIDQALDKLSQ